MKQLSLRRADCCALCGVQLAVGDRAWWDVEARKVLCVRCFEGGIASPPVEKLYESSGVSIAPALPFIETGVAGKTAMEEYQRRHERREAQIEAKFGMFAGIVKFLSDDPQSTIAWKKGSIGEQKLASVLVENLGDRVILLNDRKVPKSRANIDHIAIAPSGVWVIDAKNYSGLVQQRDVGGFFSTDIRLFVDGRDKTKLADGLEWQLKAVRSALDSDEIAVKGALCFTDAEWGWFAKPFSVRGAFVSGPNALSRKMAEIEALSKDRIWQIAERLAKALPAK